MILMAPFNLSELAEAIKLAKELNAIAREPSYCVCRNCYRILAASYAVAALHPEHVQVLIEPSKLLAE